LAGYVNTKDGEKFLRDLCIAGWDDLAPEEVEQKHPEKRDADFINFFIENGTWPEEVKKINGT
jgi:hypothetical protein